MKRFLAMLLAVAMMLPGSSALAAERLTIRSQETDLNAFYEEETEENTEILIDATDYGADPAGIADSTDAIWKALEAAKEASEKGTKPVTVVFPKGEYHIYKDRAQQREYHTSNTNSIENPIKYIGILIEDQKNLTIEGNGSLFMMHGNMMALAVVRSENVKLHDFSWDYTVPTVTEMTVIGMADNYTDFYIPQCFPYEIQGNTIVWKSDISPYTGDPYWTRTGEHENSYSVVTYQPDEEMTRIYGSGQGPFNGATSIEQLGENKVRIYYNTRPSMQKLGMVMQFCSSAVRHTAGAFTWESKEVTAEKVNVHFMDGFGWLIQMSENVYYKDCNLMPRENSGHITVSFADGIHASGAAGKIVIENCNFSHTHDDPINLHGTFTRVEERVDDTTLKLKYIHGQQGGFPQYHVGDKVQFFTRDTLESTDGETEYEVSEIVSNPGEDGNDLRTMVIKFKETLPTNLSDMINGQPKYVAENVTYAPAVEIRNCTFKNIATRGILCTTRNKVVIEDNIFYPTSMATIFLSNDSNDWYESGPIRDMTIRGNTFYVKDIGGKTSWRYASAIYVHPVTKGGGLPAASNPIHKNITIEDNVFYMDGDAVVKAESVENLQFKNNKILRMNPNVVLTLNPVSNALNSGETMSLNLQKTGTTLGQNIDNIFDFTKSKDVVIAGNTYDDGMKRYVVADTDTQSTLQVEDTELSVVNNDNGSVSEAVGEVIFINSNPKVLFVDDYGTVTALAEGSATIYAYYRWNDTVIKSNEVTINVTGEAIEAQTWNDGITIKREETGHYEVNKNSYTVDLQAGDLWTSFNTLKNLFLYDPADVNKEDFRAIVKVENLPVNESGQWDTVSFMLYKDDDNYITVGKKSHKAGFSYVVEQSGNCVETDGSAEDNGVTTAYLGITKVGDNVTLSAKAEGGSWKDVATVTQHTVGSDYQLGLGAWETNDRSKTITFSDLKIGTSADSYETLETKEAVDFLKPIEKNQVNTEELISNHAAITNISMAELGFEETTLSEDYYHITAEAEKQQATLSVTKDAESKEIQIFQGDYRIPLELMENENTYSVLVEFIDGINTFYIRVYAQDGITYKQYILGVTYTPDYEEKELSNGLLKEVIFNGKDITSDFIITGTSGKKKLAKDTMQLKVTVEEGAKVTFGIEGNELPEAVSSVMEKELQLNQGEQKVKIVITSANEEEQKIYSFDVEKTSYLSDLEWISATVGYGNGVNRDANHNGTQIKLADEEGNAVGFEKGLGIHAASVIQYNIAEVDYNRLQGYVGLDYCQYGADYGDVQFIILIDGEQVFDSGNMTNTMPMKKVDVTIPNGAQLLELQATLGNSGHNWNDHANWADMKFLNVSTVTFNSDGGSFVEAQTVEIGKTAREPKAPTKTGYKFLGWYVTGAEGVETVYDFATVVNSDITLTAKWLDMGDIEDEDQKDVEDIEQLEKIWAVGVKDVIYNGSKHTFELRVYDGNKKLEEGKDYTVSYKNNTNVYECEGGLDNWDTYINAIEGKETEDATGFVPNSSQISKFKSKAPQVILKMKGNYQKNQTIYFKINPVNIKDASDKGMIVPNNLTVTKASKPQKPAVTILWKETGKNLKLNKDYTLEVKALNESGEPVGESLAKVGEGTYSLTLEGTGNFTGTINETYKVDAAESLSKAKVKVNKVAWADVEKLSEEEFAKKVIKSVKVKSDLEPGEDYQVTNITNTNTVGTGYLTIEGKGSYVGSKTVAYTITGTAMSKVDVKDIYKKGYSYTGEEIRPLELTEEENDGKKVTVVKKGTTENLTMTTDEVEGHYSVTYQKNVNKGTATMLLTGNPKMGYTGTKKVTFKIVAYDLDKSGVESIILEEEKVEYTTGGATPKVVVVDKNGNTLVEGKDYTLSYKNNKTVTKDGDTKVPTVVVKGKGNYTKSIDTTFRIVQKDINAVEGECPVTISVKDKVHKSGKNNWKPSFKVLDENKKAINKAEYDVTYTLNGEEVTLDDKKEAEIGDKVEISVTFKNDNGEGNYTGIVSKTYRMINKKYDISKATIKIKNQEYTGDKIVFTKETQAEQFDKFFLKVDGEEIPLVIDENIEVVSYQKNIGKGTAKVTFRGLEVEGEEEGTSLLFGGEKTVTFKIVQKNVVANWWKKLIEKTNKFVQFIK